MENIKQNFAQQGLIRPRDGRVFGGVVAGLGRRFGIDPWPARLLFIVLLMVIPGSQLLIYPVLWVLMPSEQDAQAWPAVSNQSQPPHPA
jgi:phage shock protein C